MSTIIDHPDNRSHSAYSPSASNVLHFSDGSKAMVVAVLALVLGACAAGGLIVGAIVVPDIIQARARTAAAAAHENARIAEREARVAIDRTDALRMELGKRGIHIRTDDH